MIAEIIRFSSKTKTAKVLRYIIGSCRSTVATPMKVSRKNKKRKQKLCISNFFEFTALRKYFLLKVVYFTKRSFKQTFVESFSAEFHEIVYLSQVIWVWFSSDVYFYPLLIACGKMLWKSFFIRRIAVTWLQ